MYICICGQHKKICWYLLSSSFMVSIFSFFNPQTNKFQNFLTIQREHNSFFSDISNTCGTIQCINYHWNEFRIFFDINFLFFWWKGCNGGIRKRYVGIKLCKRRWWLPVMWASSTISAPNTENALTNSVKFATDSNLPNDLDI